MAHFQEEGKSDAPDSNGTHSHDRAYSLISSPAARERFDIEKEPAPIRDEYGRNTAGARMPFCTGDLFKPV